MLTARENTIINGLPPIYREFVEAKFKTKINVYSGADLYALVKELINDILFSSGVKDKGDQRVKDYLTKTLTEDLQHPKFASLTFDEVEIACKKGVRQEYGVYMGVNIQTIHSWLRAYLNSKERELAIREFYSKVSEVENGKVDKLSEVNPEGQRKVIEALKSIIKKVPDEEAKKPNKLVNLSKEKSPRDQYIQKCFTDFENLYGKNPYRPLRPENKPGMVVTEGGGKYIFFEGKPVDQVEYAQIKLKEYDSLNLNTVE